MIGYITLGTADMEKAKTFYSTLLADMGAKVLFDGGRIAFIGKSMAEPCIAVCTPYDEATPQSAGNGNMVAIDAGSRENVDTLYNKALELGATCDGPAGERMPTFYGAYVRDSDGNKVCFYKMG
ncbi:MAG: VOC family protein [Pseudomonadales bacterium]|jgi:predicted lactoylglutathione lyase